MEHSTISGKEHSQLVESISSGDACFNSPMTEQDETELLSFLSPLTTPLSRSPYSCFEGQFDDDFYRAIMSSDPEARMGEHPVLADDLLLRDDFAPFYQLLDEFSPSDACLDDAETAEILAASLAADLSSQQGTTHVETCPSSDTVVTNMGLNVDQPSVPTSLESLEFVEVEEICSSDSMLGLPPYVLTDKTLLSLLNQYRIITEGSAVDQGVPVSPNMSSGGHSFQTDEANHGNWGGTTSEGRSSAPSQSEDDLPAEPKGVLSVTPTFKRNGKACIGGRQTRNTKRPRRESSQRRSPHRRQHSPYRSGQKRRRVSSSVCDSDSESTQSGTSSSSQHSKNSWSGYDRAGIELEEEEVAEKRLEDLGLTVAAQVCKLARPVPYDIELERKKRFKVTQDEARAPRKVLFVGGVDDHTTSASLTNLFQRFGCIQDVRIVVRKGGENFAFVYYEEEQSTQKAIDAAGLPEFSHLQISYGGRRTFVCGSYVDFDANNEYIRENMLDAPKRKDKPTESTTSYEEMLKQMLVTKRSSSRP